MLSEALVQRHVLSLLRDRYAQEGFSFMEHPPRNLLPSEFGSYRPEAIAVSEREKHAIEVVVRGGRTRPRLAEASRLVASAPGWRLRIIEPGLDLPAPMPSTQVSEARLSSAIAELRSLVESGHGAAALLYGAAVLEAALRKRLLERYGWQSVRPADLRQLLSVAEVHGEIESEERRALAEVLTQRNRLAHGGLDAPDPAGAAAQLLALCDRLAAAPAA